MPLDPLDASEVVEAMAANDGNRRKLAATQSISQTTWRRPLRTQLESPV